MTAPLTGDALDVIRAAGARRLTCHPAVGYLCDDLQPATAVTVLIGELITGGWLHITGGRILPSDTALAVLP